MKTLRSFILALFVLLTLAAPLAAQGDEPTDDEVNAIAKQLYCPVCENIPLDVCGTQACVQWRATIRELLAQGYSEEEIKQYFADQYGDRVLAEPPARGLNILFWVLPPIVIVGGGVFVWRFFRQGSPTSPDRDRSQETSDFTSDEEYIARLERDLERRRR